MKIQNSFPVPYFFGAVFAAACLAACEPEYGRDGSEFPSDIRMAFSASAEDWGYGENGSLWQGGEAFSVCVGGVEKRYVIADAVSGELVADGDPFYWQDNKDVIVDAWYPYSEGGMPDPVAKADQSTLENYRASDFLAAVRTPVSISLSTSPLEFAHRTANVVINLEIGPQVDPAAVEVRLLNVAGLDSGTELSPFRDGNSFRAMVVPQNMQDVDFISVEAGEYSLLYAPGSFREGYLRADRQYSWTFAIEGESIKLIANEGNPEWESAGEENIEAEFIEQAKNR